MPHIHYNMETDLDEIIRPFARLHLRRMELANIQSPMERGLWTGVKIHQNSLKFSILDEFYGFNKVWFFIALPHTVSNQKNID